MLETLDVVLGSTSDEEKIVPGTIQFTKENPESEVRIHFTSIDNTPGKTYDLAPVLMNHRPNVFISGAGLRNGLTVVIKTYSVINDLNIGIPISDDASGGLTALLSTAETPPRNPVLTVGINNSYAALNIAHRFLQGLGGVVVYDNERVAEQVKILRQKCEELGLPYTAKKHSEITPDDLVLRVFDPYRGGVLADGLFMSGKGVQVGVSGFPIDENPMKYRCALYATSVTGIVSCQGYDNAVQMAAILSRNTDVLDRIRAAKDKKAEELRAHKGLRVTGAAVVRL